MNTLSSPPPVYEKPSFVPQPATPAYPVYSMASEQQPQFGTEPIRFKKNLAPIISLCLLVTFHTLLCLFYLTMTVLLGFSIYRLYMASQSICVATWSIVALTNKKFFLEPKKLKKRCGPWLGMSAAAMVAYVLSMLFENTLDMHYVGNALFNLAVFYGLKNYKNYNKSGPWKVVQPDLPQYYHYQTYAHNSIR